MCFHFCCWWVLFSGGVTFFGVEGVKGGKKNSALKFVVVMVGGGGCVNQFLLSALAQARTFFFALWLSA